MAAAIDVPDIRAVALVAVADALPDAEHDRKLALLDRAALQAKAATRRPQFRLQAMGEVAERWFELGEKEKAKALFAEGLRLANQIPAKAELLARQIRRAAGSGRPAVGPGHRQGIPRAVVPILKAGSSGTSPSAWPRRIPPKPNEC